MGEPLDDPLARLRALDQALARRGASDHARAAVRRKLQQRSVEHRFHVRLRWWPAVAFVAGAIAMGVVLVPDDPPSPATPSAVAEAVPGASPPRPGVRDDAPPRPAAAVAPAEPRCFEPRAGIVILETDRCVLGDGVRVSALSSSQLVWDDGAVEVRAGELLFDVAPRPDRPLRVVAGALEIEVVGTRFVVHHDATGGWVSMLEGHVRTRVDGGPVQDLRDGQRLAWPSALTPAPLPGEPAPAKPTRGRPKPAAVDEALPGLLAEVAELRRRGAYREAVARLRASDTQRWSARARQLVSYEIGTLLERQLGDVAQACAHWTEHRRRYPSGRYDAIVARSLERLRCAAAE